MSIQVVRFATHRTLLVGDLCQAMDESLRAPFAALLPAYGEAERRVAESIVGELVDLGCVELCCVGPEAEQLHDSIDWIIEDRGNLEVVTTADTDLAEACAYFVTAAASEPAMLLALVSAHPDLVASLVDLCGRQVPGTFNE